MIVNFYCHRIFDFCKIFEKFSNIDATLSSRFRQKIAKYVKNSQILQKRKNKLLKKEEKEKKEAKKVEIYLELCYIYIVH